jgi:Putative MetA-pathway of phenol degradation
MRPYLLCCQRWFGALAFALSATANAQAQQPPTTIREAVESLRDRVNLALGFPPEADSDQLSGAFGELLALEVSTAPNGTPSGGLTFSFDEGLGTFKRSSPTFGPAFAERSLTGGARKLSVGVSFLRSSYDSVAGQKTSQIVVAKSGNDPRSIFAVDLSTATTVVVANYGVTDTLDVGVVVPWISTSLSGELALLGSPGVSIPLSKISTTGVGDIAMLAKYRFWPQEQGGLAAGLELHIPSGDTAQSRGLGTTRSLMSLIWSRGGRVAPHANAGYEFWAKAVPISPRTGVNARNQMKYAGGIEVNVNPRLTLLADLVGRRVFGGGRLGYQPVIFMAEVPVSTDLLAALPGGLNIVSAAPGFKWNVGGNALFSASVLVTLVNKGLRANVTPVVGIDWTF